MVRQVGLAAFLATAACAGSGELYTPEQQVENRADFDVMALGEFFAGSAEVVAACEARLTPQEAYPGIANEAIWIDLVALRLDRVEASASNGELEDRLIVDNNDFPVGHRIDLGYWVVAPYDGPTAPGVDAEFTCGAFELTSATVRRTLEAGLAGGFNVVYGLSLDESAAEIQRRRANAQPFRTTQETFLAPFHVADSIVGEVNWPPPSSGRNDES